MGQGEFGGPGGFGSIKGLRGHVGIWGDFGGLGGIPRKGLTPVPPSGPPGTLLVSTRHQVLALGGPEPQILRGPIKHAAALDVGIEGGSLFWGDPSEGLIYR